MKNKDSSLLPLYPLSLLPKDLVFNICEQLTYIQAVGNTDLSGELWESLFATSTNGIQIKSSVGIIDVVKDNQAWSIKTVKNKNITNLSSVRIISGRNNITYSYKIENPFDDITLTGKCVLEIYNKRVLKAQSQHNTVRTSILIRSNDLSEFIIFEVDTKPYNPDEYFWTKNKNGNLEGKDKNGLHVFTWQPNGSQFTIIYQIPKENTFFKLKKPKKLDFKGIMKMTGFNKDWIS
jgi:hypothetical protein